MPDRHPYILEVSGLTKTFSKDGASLHVLQDIDFQIAAGSTCAVVGPSGSGKTTLLGLCAGLDTPTAGTVHLDHQEITRLNEDARARLRNQLVGFVFQNFQLIPTLTALENVMVPLELRGDAGARGRARTLLAQVGLAERQTHFPAQLSGGEQQRVALARAFINQPKILFADEPTGNLDDATSETVVNLLFALNESRKTTLVLVTHDLELARRTERVITLKGGRMVEATAA